MNIDRLDDYIFDADQLVQAADQLGGNAGGVVGKLNLERMPLLEHQQGKVVLSR